MNMKCTRNEELNNGGRYSNVAGLCAVGHARRALGVYMYSQEDAPFATLEGVSAAIAHFDKFARYIPHQDQKALRLVAADALRAGRAVDRNCRPSSTTQLLEVES